MFFTKLMMKVVGVMKMTNGVVLLRLIRLVNSVLLVMNVAQMPMLLKKTNTNGVSLTVNGVVLPFIYK